MGELVTLAVLRAISLLFGYAIGWSSGRSSGKVTAIEALQDVDLSGGDDDA